MGQIRITVGAAKDRSVDDVFDGIIGKAKRARSQVAAEARASASESNAAWKSAERELARMERERTAEVKKQAGERTKAERNAQRDTEREAKRAAKSIADTEREVIREMGRERDRAASEEKRRIQSIVDAQKRAAKDRDKAIAGAVSGGAGLAGRVIRYGADVVGAMARGSGLDTDMASHFMNAANLQTTATNISNSGYMKGDARNGTRVDPKELEDQLMATGTATGFSGNDMGEALSEFVAKTGDLKTGRDIIMDIGRLSKATGTDVRDMAGAAGELANAFKDTPDGAARTADALKFLAGQGKLGAVEIKDLATQASKITASAGRFEGDTSKNVAGFGAMAQLAKSRGGATSAAEAATSVTAFASMFSKGARLDAFAALGVKTKGAGGKVRNAEDIIADSLSATRGDDRKMGTMFASVQARKATLGAEALYKTAYAATSGTDDEKNAAGVKAFRDEFEKLQNSTMDATEIQDSFNAAMNTSQSKAQIMNNELDRLATTTATAMSPAFEKLAPVLIDQVIPAVADLATQAAAFAAWFASTNADNTKAVQDTTASGNVTVDKNLEQLKSGKVTRGQYDSSVRTEHDLAQKLATQGEDNTGSAHHALKGFVSGALGKEWDNISGANGASGVAAGLMPGVAELAGIRGARDQMARGKTEDALSEKSNAEGNKTLAELKKTNELMLEAMRQVATNTGSTPGGTSGGAAPPAGKQI